MALHTLMSAKNHLPLLSLPFESISCVNLCLFVCFFPMCSGISHRPCSTACPSCPAPACRASSPRSSRQSPTPPTPWACGPSRTLRRARPPMTTKTGECVCTHADHLLNTPGLPLGASQAMQILRLSLLQAHLISANRKLEVIQSNEFYLLKFNLLKLFLLLHYLPVCLTSQDLWINSCLQICCILWPFSTIRFVTVLLGTV